MKLSQYLQDNQSRPPITLSADIFLKTGYIQTSREVDTQYKNFGVYTTGFCSTQGPRNHQEDSAAVFEVPNCFDASIVASALKSALNKIHSEVVRDHADRKVGTCASVIYVPPINSNEISIYGFSAGDSYSVLFTYDKAASNVSYQLLTKGHPASSESERKRIIDAGIKPNKVASRLTASDTMGNNIHIGQDDLPIIQGYPEGEHIVKFEKDDTYKRRRDGLDFYNYWVSTAYAEALARYLATKGLVLSQVHRVSGLGLARALGVSGTKCEGVSCDIDVLETKIQCDKNKRRFAMSFTDGAYNGAVSLEVFLTQCCEIIKQAIKDGREMLIPNLIEAFARNGYEGVKLSSNDNVTVVCTELFLGTMIGLVQGAFDGHGGAEASAVAAETLEGKFYLSLGEVNGIPKSISTSSAAQTDALTSTALPAVEGNLVDSTVTNASTATSNILRSLSKEIEKS